MDIGIPRERRADEHRVGMTPAGVQLLVAEGHTCYVESGAGLGAGFSDEDYTRSGARLVYSGEEAYGRATMVTKVARPSAAEMPWLRSGQAVLAFWHLATAAPAKVEMLLKDNITAIAYELIREADGTFPVLRPMSQIAGRMSANVAAALLRNDRGGKGILLGGVPGVPPAQVVILGAGVVGSHAARAFSGMGATVYVLDHDLRKLELIAEQDSHVITMVSHSFNIRKVVRFADVIVGAVLTPGARAPILISQDLLREMRPRSVIVDVAIDQGGCVETSRPTSHQSSTFVAENIIHYCVPNMAGVLGRTATHALNVAAWPFLQDLAARGIAAAMQHNAVLRQGVLTHEGQIVSPLISREARP